MKSDTPYPSPDQRSPVLVKIRNLKMAGSPHRYVRGSTVKFYEWLDHLRAGALPDGPPVWICGDCHMGNLGPVANAAGQIEIQIRDLDQTVIGNPAHDLVRLGLSLASAARGSDLPGVTTAKMLERMMEGYAKAFEPDFHEEIDVEQPKSIRSAIGQSVTASWKTLANERIEDAKPTIPLGKRFWPVSAQEKQEISSLFDQEQLRRIATMLRSRDDDSSVEMMDAAYWVKGCSSLGRLRFAVLLGLDAKNKEKRAYCLMDIKEAIDAAAPRAAGVQMPSEQAQRVVDGARHLSPHIGKRMLATKMVGKSVFVRELLPQDLKLKITQLSRDEAMRIAEYLAAVVGKAHSRQMDAETRKGWQAQLNRNRSKQLDAPTWLWTSIVELLAIHESAYLEHCREYALEEENEQRRSAA